MSVSAVVPLLGLVGEPPHAAEVQARPAPRRTARAAAPGRSRTGAARSPRRPPHRPARRRTSSRRCGTPRESRRWRRASARRRRSTSSASSRNEPVNGTASRNATATAQMPSAIDSHSGNDQASATSSRPGRRIAPRPRRELLGDPRDQPGQRRRQHLLEPRRARGRAAPGSPASDEQHDERDERRRRRRVAPAHLTRGERRRVGARRDRGRRRTRTTRAARARSTMSSSRSRMIVANAPVALMPSRWRAPENTGE